MRPKRVGSGAKVDCTHYRYYCTHLEYIVQDDSGAVCSPTHNVILSAASTSRSEVLAESKDPAPAECETGAAGSSLPSVESIVRIPRGVHRCARGYGLPSTSRLLRIREAATALRMTGCGRFWNAFPCLATA